MPRPRVLVVTDHPETTELIRATLAAERYDADTAGHGALALERFSQQHYDLLLSSVRLPDLGGPELYWALRTRWLSASSRVIFIDHAGAPIHTPGWDIARPEAQVLPTPFTAEALRDTVRRALGVL